MKYKGKDYMRNIVFTGNDTSILNNYPDLLEQTQKKIASAEGLIRAICRQDEICRLLTTIPGIGDILAVTIRYEIDDIGRFVS